MIDCPTCKGDGVLRVFSREHPIIPCHFCNGEGKVNDIHLKWMKEGKILREKRIAKRLTIRKAAKLHKMRPSDLCNMEIGLIQPRKDISYETIKTIKQ